MEDQVLILAVDDDPNVLRLMTFMLRKAGFAVLPAESAAEALELFRHEWRSISLVISDMIMPGMSTVELVRLLRQECPECRLLLCSGYASECEELALQLGHARSLPKPFSADSLRTAVQAALNA